MATCKAVARCLLSAIVGALAGSGAGLSILAACSLGVIAGIIASVVDKLCNLLFGDDPCKSVMTWCDLVFSALSGLANCFLGKAISGGAQEEARSWYGDCPDGHDTGNWLGSVMAGGSWGAIMRSLKKLLCGAGIMSKPVFG